MPVKRMNHSRGRLVVLPSPAGSNPGDPAFNLLFWSLGSSPAMGESTGPRNCLGNSRSNGSTNSSASDLDLAFEWGVFFSPLKPQQKTWEILGSSHHGIHAPQLVDECTSPKARKRKRHAFRCHQNHCMNFISKLSLSASNTIYFGNSRIKKTRHGAIE